GNPQNHRLERSPYQSAGVSGAAENERSARQNFCEGKSMTDVGGKIDRLLRAAALTKEEASLDAPFGFDTRIVSLWRAKEKAASLSLARLVRRVALIAVAVAVIAGAGA